MYEIIITGSTEASGNLSGCLQHSMSNASTRGSPKTLRCGISVRLDEAPSSFTVYHLPTRRPVSIDMRWWYGTSYSRMSSMRSSQVSLDEAAATAEVPPAAWLSAA